MRWRGAVTLAGVAALSLCAASISDAEPAADKAAETEIALRALESVGGETIRPEHQHCNLGSVYLQRINPQEQRPVAIREPLIGELAEMAQGGRNHVVGRCRGANPATCYLGLFHAKGEDVSSTEYRFTMIAGKVQADTLDCVSTP